MSTALQKPPMTRDEFFAWAQAQEARYEFDGFRPVAMTGGTITNARIVRNILRALGNRLHGPCEPLGQDAGVVTVGDTVRYPDALVTCSEAGNAYLVPGVVVVFEVLNPTSGRTDRIVKLREYRAVPSIRRYVILEHSSAASPCSHAPVPTKTGSPRRSPPRTLWACPRSASRFRLPNFTGTSNSPRRRAAPGGRRCRRRARSALRSVLEQRRQGWVLAGPPT